MELSEREIVRILSWAQTVDDEWGLDVDDVALMERLQDAQLDTAQPLG